MGQNEPIDLDTVADELYGLVPSEFTSRRDARAAEARKAGDKALSAEIKKLRRPTTGAWLANLVARDYRDQVARLLDLGVALRQAQAELATADLRRLSSERHQALAELEKEARALASHYGQPVSEAAAQELAATLEAALADEAAAEALRAGRLTAGLHYSGLGLVGGPEPEDLTLAGGPEPDGLGLVGGPGADGRVGPERSRGHADPGRAGQVKAAGGHRAGAGAEIEALVAKAEAGVAAAEREAADRRARLDEARAGRDRSTAEVADLQKRLETVREEERAAGTEVRAAEQALKTAERAVIAARDELVRARAAMGRSSSSHP